ncbi:hypothetical protein [Aulosira sp. FACHB-615]|uniref:hypothetical protein n=1 Tax=Aulosira sp. FACHB-615 TaxID=2692777 RepID=UPI001689F6C4|nr:hypothetical protein [Aulosira sp. FACHB-615]MBD2489022.1 hypothetical protein [Aulosira sp. FACHB-615]
MKINNALLLSLLFRDFPEIATQVSNTIAYVAVINGRPCLILCCPDLLTTTLLFNSGEIISTKLKSFLNFEILLECSHEAIGEVEMVAVADRVENSNVSEIKLLNIETLALATNQSIPKVKILLAQAGAPVYPQTNGTEAIEETVFDAVLLTWAKSLKEGGQAKTEDPKQSEAKPRKASAKVLTAELTADDIIKVKSGSNAGSPNLTQRGVQQTLENFFNKVKFDDTTKVDAVSAFIEGTSEFGQALRKKIAAAYKKFTTKPNMEEVETKLIEGAKTYLESMAATASEE